MTENAVPSTALLFIDDSEQVTVESLTQHFPPSQFHVSILHPEEVYLADLRVADLVVVDYFLSSWSERDDLESVSRSPLDGLSVIGNLRSNLLPPLDQRTGFLPPNPVAFALWSGHLSQATLGLPEVVRPHVFSRENNLEWAFDRNQLLSAPGVVQLTSLARAIRTVKEVWTQDEGQAEDELALLLDLPVAASWRHDAQSDVLDCRPPLHELGKRTHGMALVRWLLHRVLPYPCFLMDEQQLKVRLRVDALNSPGAEDGPLIEALDGCLYTGALHEFLGRRWWRAGVENWVFEQTDGAAGDSLAVRDLAESYGATSTSNLMRPVLVLDGDLRTKDVPVEISKVVRIRPDDWPAYADAAYALTIDVLDDEDLRRLVDPADRYLIDDLDENA